jgi:adenine/guanine phosphoribosyltransferase-like PRPP-binding protein
MSVRRKLNAMSVVFAGKSVLLIDDSIVRGTTMSQIVDMVRNAGAKKVRGGRVPVRRGQLGPLVDSFGHGALGRCH